MSDDSITVWQTEPPTEAGWYPAILKYADTADVFYLDSGEYDETDATRIMAHQMILAGNLVVASYDLAAFTHWWPIPITLPELPT